MSVQTLKDEMRKLTKPEQLELVHYMIELLATDDFTLSAEWKSEISRREEALNNGSSVGVSAKEVIYKYIANR